MPVACPPGLAHHVLYPLFGEHAGSCCSFQFGTGLRDHLLAEFPQDLRLALPRHAHQEFQHISAVWATIKTPGLGSKVGPMLPITGQGERGCALWSPDLARICQTAAVKVKQVVRRMACIVPVGELGWSVMKPQKAVGSPILLLLLCICPPRNIPSSDGVAWNGGRADAPIIGGSL